LRERFRCQPFTRFDDGEKLAPVDGHGSPVCERIDAA
jgi:hypothetical protein